MSVGLPCDSLHLVSLCQVLQTTWNDLSVGSCGIPLHVLDWEIQPCALDPTGSVVGELLGWGVGVTPQEGE